MFAPQHHAAMKHVVPVRKALGVRTIFNLLGPLTNPAGAPHQVIGVSDGPFLEHMAMALARLGGRSALVVSSEDGLDEISISAPTRVVELRDGKVETYTVTPEDLGVERAPIDAIAFGAPEENARDHARRPVRRRHRPGAVADARERRRGGLRGRRGGHAPGRRRRGGDAVESGAANELMERFVSRTQELAPA